MTDIALISNDGIIFEEPRILFKNSMIDDVASYFQNTPIPLDNINGCTLKRIIRWLKLRQELIPRKGSYFENQLIMKSREEARLKTEGKMIIDVIYAANFLDIAPLVEAACRIAAEMVTEGSLLSLDGLNGFLEEKIAEYVLPYGLQRAIKNNTLRITPQHQAHNALWTSIFTSDDLFFKACAVGANPVLIGKDLQCDGPKYLVLACLDWTGDLGYDIKPNTIRDYLHDHEYDPETYECTMKQSKMILNISEFESGQYSTVCDLEARLVKRIEGSVEKRVTAVVSLRNPRIRCLTSNSKANGRVQVVCQDSLNPYSGNVLEWLCIDYRLASCRSGYKKPSEFR